MTGPLLEAADLTVDLPGANGPARAVDGVSFAMGRERLGVVGESGAGKSTLGRCLLGLLPPGARVSARRLRLGARDLRTDAAAARGRAVGLIPQEPRQALNPVMRVGAQIAETLRVHRRAPTRRAARALGLAMLESVRIADPERVWRAWPHELSGGLAQRAVIAMALAPGPALLVADEPTSALDAMARARVLAVIDEQARARGMGVILIGHDLPLVRRFCDRLLVMRRGRVVEALGAADEPRHPWTRRLLAAAPVLAA